MKPGRYFWTRVPHWLLFTIVPKTGAFLRKPWAIAGGISCLLVVIYILTGPWIMPSVIERPYWRVLYLPILHAIEDDWFGRDFFYWYYIKVCHINMLFVIYQN
jgi:hypothetical protein